MTTTPKWHDIYKAALLETDWSRMDERIQAAEAAIRDRRHEFDLNHGGTPEENQAITDALHSLKVLRTELASWSLRKEKNAS
jgi:hypothetical protein